MTDETQAKALEMLQGVAGKIGSTIETLWPEAVKYVAAEGAVAAIAGIVMILLIVAAVVLVWKNTDDVDDYDNLVPASIARLLSTAAAAILVPVLLFNTVVPSAAQALAPQGYLVTKIVTGAAK